MSRALRYTDQVADAGKSSDAVSGFFDLAANGNPLAGEWLTLWHRFAHSVDDVIDLNQWTAEPVLASLVQACDVYSHQFYRDHAAVLQPVCLLATGIYELANKWEQPERPLWSRQFADVFRHSGNDVILTVALICGGYEHFRKVAAPLYASCFIYHKDRYGLPT